MIKTYFSACSFSIVLGFTFGAFLWIFISETCLFVDWVNFVLNPKLGTNATIDPSLF